jgi:radical SAM protein with 4Fe4S-binding SPASM domain
MNDSKTFCSMAWNHQFIDPTGRVKPCCRFAEAHRPAAHNLNSSSLEDIFHSEWMNDLRNRMLTDQQHPGCIRCYQEEDSGKLSLRERYNKSKELPITKLVNIENPTIKWIELAISNDCNLACRMCDSRYAWKWFKEEKEIYGKTLNTVEHSKSDISNIFPFIDNIVHIKFTGGEPLITPDHWRLLNKLLAERDCSEIFLNYSTNCTIMPKDEWVEKWSKFKRVEFALSFDSCNKEESEYIRWPSAYEHTESVAKRFLELKDTHNFDIILRSTISILNVWHLPETLEWWWQNNLAKRKSLNPTHLTFPKILSVTVLPDNIKKQIVLKFTEYQNKNNIQEINESLEYIKNYMNSSDDSHLLPELKTYLEKTDSYRKQNFASDYPHFKEIFINF